MPKEFIDRAIAGLGADAGADAFEEIVYEGYGPEGVAVIVEALTDNRNRTASDVRHTFAKHGGNLGATGAVAWQFERRGVVVVPAEGVDEEELLLAAADGGADDFEQDGTVFEVTAPPEALSSVRAAIEEAGFSVDSAELSMVPKTTVAVEDEAKASQVMRLIDELVADVPVEAAASVDVVPGRGELTEELTNGLVVLPQQRRRVHVQPPGERHVLQRLP